jgi:hypothetical protein
LELDTICPSKEGDEMGEGSSQGHIKQSQKNPVFCPAGIFDKHDFRIAKPKGFSPGDTSFFLTNKRNVILTNDQERGAR